MVGSTKKNGRSSKVRRKGPTFRTQPEDLARETIDPDAVRVGRGYCEPSLGRAQLVWLTHELAWEWVRYVEYLEALAFPNAPPPEARSARAMARAVNAVFGAYLRDDADDLEEMERLSLTVLRREFRNRKKILWANPMGVLWDAREKWSIPTSIRDARGPLGASTHRSMGDPFRTDDKRDLNGRALVVRQIVYSLARNIGAGLRDEEIAHWLVTGSAPLRPGLATLHPAPFDQLKGFFRDRGVDHACADEAKIARTTQRTLLDFRASTDEERETLAEMLLRRAVATLVGKDAAKNLFDGKRKQLERSEKRKGRTAR
jgi:hypothetical protein